MSRPARCRSAGQSMVEFALILPIFMMLIFGALDLGRAIFYQSMVNNAARDGARYAITNPADTCSSGTCGTTTYAKTSVSGFGSQMSVCSAYFYSSAVLGSSGTTVPPPCPDTNTTSATYGYVTVVVSIPFQPITGFFGKSWTVTLSSQSTMMFSP